MIYVQWLIAETVSVQRDIYLAFADRIKLFAETGDWSELLVYLPMGIVFGAVHAITPGHSKIIMASYLAGSPAALRQGLGVALLLSFVHVAMSVLIVVLSLPLVSVALGSVGQAPLLQDLSRGLLGIIGLWMIWRAIRPARHHHEWTGSRNAAFAIFAGLIPCPLTFFVMTFAVVQGVTVAGLAFAGVMMIGVALTLSVVAVLAVLMRSSVTGMARIGHLPLERLGRILQFVMGIMLVMIAVNELF